MKPVVYRDVSNVLVKLRSFLLGRRFELEDVHLRFEPSMSPRSIPPPQIPKGPDGQRFFDHYYFNRDLKASVKLPVIAPIAEGNKGDPYSPEDIYCFFTYAPTPGPVWWWDGHNYYERQIPYCRC